MSDTCIHDFVSNTINIAIAAAGEEQDGAAPPQDEMRIMVHATCGLAKHTRILHFLSTYTFRDLCG